MNLYFIIQIENNYILCSLKNIQEGVSTYIINQKKAHQRIIFERQLKALKNENIVSQRLMSAVKIDLQPNDIHLIEENEKVFNEIGYDFKKINTNTIEIHAIPSSFIVKNPKDQIESFLEELKNKNLEISLKKLDMLAKSVAFSCCVKKNQKLNEIEMIQLVRSLFKCESPFLGLDGKPCVVLFEPKKIFEL